MSEDQLKLIRVGSRKSELALIQTKHVISLLQSLYTNVKFEIHTMSTIGDRILNISLPKIGEKSLFTKDLEDALCNGVVDFVVHSLKDLPTQLPPNMVIGAVLEREDPRDALILNAKYAGKTLGTLPPCSIIGTSSLRRTAQIARRYPHLIVQDIRGNLNTRLAKLDDENSKFAGIVLAHAGLIRMGWEKRISQILDADDILYAVGQGALAVECCINNKEILDMLKNIVCLQTQCKILVERSFLKTLGGGCSAPVAVNTTLDKYNTINSTNEINTVDAANNDNIIYKLNMIGSVWSLDGKTELQCDINSNVEINSNSNHKNYNKRENDEIIEKNKKIKCNNDKMDLQQSEPIIKNNLYLNNFVKIHEHIFKESTDDIDNSLISSSSSANDCKKNVPIEKDIHQCKYANKTIEKQTSSINTADNTTESTDDYIGLKKCPLNLTIGEDVMAECPFLSAKEKIENNLIGNVCPFLASKQAKDEQQEDSGQEHAVRNLDNKIIEDLNINDNEKLLTKIFCGIYQHDCFNINLLETCENLGKNLANNLINKGALDIMKCAQSEIRSK